MIFVVFVPFAAATAPSTASWCVRFVAFVPFAAASAVFNLFNSILKVSSIFLLIH